MNKEHYHNNKNDKMNMKKNGHTRTKHEIKSSQRTDDSIT